MTGSIELVVAALAAGATAGLSDTASTAVKDAYTGLKTVTRKVLRRDRSVDAAESTGTWRLRRITGGN